jgi:predicted Zn-dependent peptidase
MMCDLDNSRPGRWAVLAVFLTFSLAGGVRCAGPGGPSGRIVTVTDEASASICLRLIFDAGSACDPPDREGLAALTAGIVERQGASAGGSAFAVNADRDVAIITGTCPVAEWPAWAERLVAVLKDPAVDPARFAAVRDAQLAALDSLRNDPSQLAQAALQVFLYGAHPYGHPPLGLEHTVRALTAADVSAFWKTHYTRGGYVIGLAGPSAENRARELDRALRRALPPGTPELPPLPTPARNGLNVRLIESPGCDSTVLCLGAPLEVVRGDSAFVALSLAVDHLGSDRALEGGLDVPLRQERNLVDRVDVFMEHRDLLGTDDTPPPRRRQYFAAQWHTLPVNSAFTVLIGLVELTTLARHGMSTAELEATDRLRSASEAQWTPCRRMAEELAGRWLDLHRTGRAYSGARGVPTPSSLRHLLDGFFPAGDLLVVAVVPDAEALAGQLLRNQALYLYPPDVDAHAMRKLDTRYFSYRPQWEIAKFQRVSASEMFR